MWKILREHGVWFYVVDGPSRLYHRAAIAICTFVYGTIHLCPLTITQKWYVTYVFYAGAFLCSAILVWKDGFRSCFSNADRGRHTRNLGLAPLIFLFSPYAFAGALRNSLDLVSIQYALVLLALIAPETVSMISHWFRRKAK